MRRFFYFEGNGCLEQNEGGYTELNKLTKQKEETEKLLEEKMERWMYLEEKAATIEKGEMEEI